MSEETLTDCLAALNEVLTIHGYDLIGSHSDIAARIGYHLSRCDKAKRYAAYLAEQAERKQAAPSLKRGPGRPASLDNRFSPLGFAVSRGDPRLFEFIGVRRDDGKLCLRPVTCALNNHRIEALVYVSARSLSPASGDRERAVYDYVSFMCNKRDLPTAAQLREELGLHTIEG